MKHEFDDDITKPVDEKMVILKICHAEFISASQKWVKEN